MGSRTAALISLLIGIMALGFAFLARQPDDSCLIFGVGLIFWGMACCLCGAFLCAVPLAARAAPLHAYVVLVAALALVAGAGYGLGYAASVSCSYIHWDWGDSVFIAWVGLAASVIGLVPGYLLGRLVRRWRRG